jgi:hypothetical protein
MTCCVTTISCNVRDVMSIIPHTIFTVEFCCLILVNKKYFLFSYSSQFVFKSTLKLNNFHTDIVQAVTKWMPMLLRHYYVHGSYFLHRKADMKLSQTRNLALTYFFLFSWMTYHHWFTVCWIGRPTKLLFVQGT